MCYQDLVDKVMEFEGFRSKPYLCPSGVLTIGYGHTHGVTKNMVVDECQAKHLLDYDLSMAYYQLRSCHLKPFSMFCPLGMALVDFVFNVGFGKYHKSTLKKVVDEIIDPNNLTDSERQRVSLQLMMWCYSKSKKLKGLEKRRAWEVSLLYE